MTMHIAVMPGDGIGKEVTAQAVRVLEALVGKEATFTEAPVGGAGLEAAGVPLPPETLKLARECDAILFGSVGGPGDESGPREKRPGPPPPPLPLLPAPPVPDIRAFFRPVARAGGPSSTPTPWVFESWRVTTWCSWPSGAMRRRRCRRPESRSARA